MSGRQNNKLPNNLPQLQNLIKRDPQSYVEEVSVVSFVVAKIISLQTRPELSTHTVPVSATVSTAVPTLPVQCADLQTAAGQAQQGAGRPCHVSCSGNLCIKVCIQWACVMLISNTERLMNSCCSSGRSLLHTASVHLPPRAVWVITQSPHSPRARLKNGKKMCDLPLHSYWGLLSFM